MSLNVGALHAEMDLNTTKFMTGVQEACKGIQKIGQELQKALSTEAAEGFTAINRRFGTLMKRMDEVSTSVLKMQGQFIEMSKNTQGGFAEMAKNAASTAKAINKIRDAAKGATDAASKVPTPKKYTGAKTASSPGTLVTEGTAMIGTATVAEAQQLAALGTVTKAQAKAAAAAKKAGQVGQAAGNATATALNKAGQAANGVTKNVKNTTASMNKLKQSAHMMGKDVGRIIGGIFVSQMFYRTIGMIQSGIESVSEYKAAMETAYISFETMLGSQDKALSFMEGLKDFAALTPYTTQEAIKMSKVLMAMGFAADSIQPMMTILTDATAAMGGDAELLERITWSLGQIKSTGKLGGQELRELGKAGIPIYDILQKKLGLTQKQLRNIGELGIDGNKAVMAILQGLQDKYAGMGEKISNTMKGALSTIYDDSLMIADKLFERPYQALLKFTRKVRDAAELSRHLLKGETKVVTEKKNDSTGKMEQITEWVQNTKGGIGALFEHWIPESLQDSLKGLIINLTLFSRIVGELFKTFAPLVGTIFVNFASILNTVAMPLLQIVLYLVQLTRAVMDNSVVIRTLVSGFIGLLIASSVARSITMLWAVIGKGGICAVVARAVEYLAVALNWLFIVFTKQPWLVVVAAAAAALLAFASSSKTVTEWLGKLQAQIATISGFSFESMFQPEDMQKYLDECSKGLEGIENSYTGIGREAQTAGNKIKNSFVASFDELYQVPDKLDDVSDGLVQTGGLADILKNIGKVSFPKIDIPELKLPKMDSTWLAALGALPALAAAKKWFDKHNNDKNDNPKGDLRDGKGFGDTSWATRFADAVKALFESGGAAIPKPIKDGKEKPVPEPAFEKFKLAFEIPNLAPFFEKMQESWANLGKQSQETLDKPKAESAWTWMTERGPQLQNWLSSIGASWLTYGAKVAYVLAIPGSASNWVWLIEKGATLKNWLTENGARWATYGQAESAALAIPQLASNWTWLVTSGLAISTWGLNAGKVFKQFQTDSDNIKVSSIKWAWTIALELAIQTLANNAKASFKTLADSAADTYDNISKNTVGFGLSIVVAFNTAVAGVYGAVAGAFKGIATGIDSILTGIKTTVNKWATDLRSTINSVLSTLASAFGGSQVGVGSNASAPNDSPNFSISGNDVAIAGAMTAVAAAALAFPALQAQLPRIEQWISERLASVGGGAPLIGALSGAHAKGTIIQNDSIVRVGEGNKNEAIIPLENSGYMKPFARAVAYEMLSMGGSNGGNNANSSVTNLYQIGTLIGDSRSLTELERRLNAVRVKENTRKGI